MSKWLVLPLLVLPYIATAASGAAPRDRDHDRLPDRWERRHHLSTSKKSAKKDPDQDGLRNLREYRLRTNPRRKDTDRDGLRDRAEVRRYHTNPRKKDTDGDGYSDGAEVRAGTNPRDPNSHPSGSSTPPAQGGLPNASNTGVPPGTALTPSGSLTINTAGAVIDARDISGSVTVNAPNVTIRRSRIRGHDFMLVRSNTTGPVVEDSELVNENSSSAENRCHNAIGFGGYTLRRTESTGCENGADAGGGNVTLVDNYVHDLDTVGPSWVFGTSGPHTDGIQMGQAASNVVIRHNWIDPSPGGGVTSGIIMYTGSGTPNSNVWIEDNYIDARGASYAVYAPRSQTHDVYINRNQMYRGVAGYTGCVRLGVTVTQFGENRDVGTGALVGPDNGAGGGCSN
jgi:hypothetical protein